MWQVSLQTDVVRSSYLEGVRAWLFHEYHYILARRGGDVYIHFYTFLNDWERANRLLSRILAHPNFSPENKPGLWFRIKDTRPLAPPARNLNRLLRRHA